MSQISKKSLNRRQYHDPAEHAQNSRSTEETSSITRRESLERDKQKRQKAASNRLKHKLNLAIVILIILIVIVYLILFFVD